MTCRKYHSDDTTKPTPSAAVPVSGSRPALRRLAVMLADVLMVMLSVPLSLLLTRSALSFDPLSLYSIAGWVLIGIFSHGLFRYSGLYGMMWRYASTPDFYYIFRNCAALSLSLYGFRLFARSFIPVTGLNERQFVALFFLTFTFVSLPRVVYCYFRERRVLFHGSTAGNLIPILPPRQSVPGPDKAAARARARPVEMGSRAAR